MTATKTRSPPLILLIDGLGWDYLESGATPFLSRLFDECGYVTSALWPTVTNVNNAAIACAAPPAITGITGNSFLDPQSGLDRYMDSAQMLNTPTLLQSWSAAGRRCCLLSVKGKTGRLLGSGVDYIVSSDQVPPEIVGAVGDPPHIHTTPVHISLARCLEWLLAPPHDPATVAVPT